MCQSLINVNGQAGGRPFSGGGVTNTSPPEVEELRCPPCPSQTHGDGVTEEGLDPLWGRCHLCLHYKVMHPSCA